MTVVRPGALRPASSTADLICAEATGVRYSIGSRLGRSLEQDRTASALALFEHLRAHQDQRIENAAHRPFPQRGVAIETRRDAVPADDAHHQARAGAGIAEIQRFARLQQRAEARAQNAPATLAEPFDLRAKRRAGAAGMQHVLAFEQPLDPRFADAQQAEQEGAMRNAFIAGRAGAATQGAAAFRRQGFGVS